MIFLHSFIPTSILFSFGPINIYWYGLFIVLGILAALYITLKISAKYNIQKEKIFDLAFWLIINGIIGARIYDVLLEHSYYISNPLAIFKIWQGGLAIHGAIIAGTITILFFARRNQLNPVLLTSIITPGLALGQAVGRWGNYFNQELFGLPTNLPWGIPISVIFRPLNYYNYKYFHPTFLYESIGNLIIFIILFIFHKKLITKHDYNNKKQVWIISTYLGLYSILRFSLEFIRIDYAPEIFGWRWPQITSCLILLLALGLCLPNIQKHAINE